MANRNVNSTQVQTAVARQGNLVVSASGEGTLIARSGASFGFETSGQVVQVNVKVGDQVEAGQVLAQLDDTLLQMKYAEAQQALQELYSAASIAAVQKEMATAKDDEFQARTWLAYLISPEVVDAEENFAIAQEKLAAAQAEAKTNPSDAANQNVKANEDSVNYLKEKLDQAWAYYKNTYGPENFTEYERQGGRHGRMVVVTYTDPYTGEVLPKIDWPSTADITTARNNYIQAQQTIKDDQAYLDALNTGVIPEGATGERLNSLYEAQLAVKDAKAALDAAKLVAPISGTITALDLNVGERAGSSSTVTISQLNQPYTLDAYLEETDWKMTKVGNKVNVTFNLLPNQTFTGTVTLVYPELSASFESSLVHFVVQLDQNISQDLPAGTGATVEVVGGEAQGAIMVPVAAIHEKENGKYAVTIIQNGQQVEREVEIGLQNDTFAEIKSGLEAGEIVVTK